MIKKFFYWVCTSSPPEVNTRSERREAIRKWEKRKKKNHR
jgi:hypothetical protein